MKRGYLLLALAGTMLAACGNRSETEIQDETESGVVLIQNKSFYEVVLADGGKLFFSSLDEDGDIAGIATSADSVECVYSYGTGFFVSQEGQIATNAHVVTSKVSEKEINKSMTKLFNSLKEAVAEAFAECSDKFDQVQNLYEYASLSYFYSGISYYDYYQIKLAKEAMEEELQEMALFYHNLDQFRASDCEIKYHNEVSIAYNNTFVTGTGDFISCVVTKVDEEDDLAILQLKDKKTPEGRYVFPVPEEDPLVTYSFMEKVTKSLKEDKNSKLFMTGFNLGPMLAITDEGIKSQFNSGAISQTQDSRIMYSIPALPGSSGSPVVNLQGQLVAINFAGINGTQNFNYGIRVKYLRELLDR